MESLHWPLTILSRAVHFKNLTGASAHVGLSQPQLSRLISQIEKAFDVSLLDRSTKRKSAWTPAAFRLAEIYEQSSRKLQSSIKEALAAQIPTHLHIGTLEGLRSLALEMAHLFLKSSQVKSLELDVFDQNDLEEKFYNGDFDFIFTSREPGRQKFKHVITLGGQTLEQIHSNDEFYVFSPYEYGQIKKKPEHKTLISNSLDVRKNWLEKYGGQGILPSDIKRGHHRDLNPVLVIGSELLNEHIWKIVEKEAKEL